MVVHVPYHSSQYEIVAFVILLKYLCFVRSSDDLFLLYNKIAIIYIVIFFLLWIKWHPKKIIIEDTKWIKCHNFFLLMHEAKIKQNRTNYITLMMETVTNYHTTVNKP
jgi:hypothetical protein